jgi:ABC-type polysaccharide/polyol phosphate export permease
VATINPLSHLIEGLRTQVITGLDIADYLVAVAIGASIFVLGVVLANLALRARLSEGS